MTLKKDALVCVSLAGVVLVMAAFSRLTPRESTANSSAKAAAPENYHKGLYQLYLEATQLGDGEAASANGQWLAGARRSVADWYERRELKAPIDFYRAAAILNTSTNPTDLSLAYEMSVTALSRGIKAAKRLVLEAQDRQLLSQGDMQRYGTQSKWGGKVAPMAGSPSPEISPQLRYELGLEELATPKVMH